MYKDSKIMENLIKLEDFTKPTKKEVAYFLGLCWGDGSIPKNGYVACIEVVQEDGEKFLSMFESLGKFGIYYRSRTDRKPQMSINIHNTEIGRFLISLDYREKSKVSPTKVLKLLDESLHRFFWLGFFDADGCCYKKGPTSQLSFCGAYDQNWDELIKFLEKNKLDYVVRQTIAKKGGQSSTVRLCSKFDIIQLGKIFYETYDIDLLGLPRKRDKFLTIEQDRKSTRPNPLGYMGIKSIGKSYCYCFIKNRKRYYQSGFLTPEGAAIAYDKKAVEIIGHKANTNFPIENYLNFPI